MLKPGIGRLLNESESVYSLVVAIARRSRDIAAEAQEKHTVLEDKAVNIAIDEFAEHRMRVVDNAGAVSEPCGDGGGPAEQPDDVQADGPAEDAE